MRKLIFTMLPLSSPKSPLAWMTVWQMQGIKSISFNRCSGGDRSGCVGQSVSASGFAFMPSFYTGFGKSALVQVNLGLPGMQTAWPEWDSLQQKWSSNLSEYDNHSYVEGWDNKQSRLFWLLFAKCPFSEKTFDKNFIPLPVFVRSWDISLATQVMLFTTAKYWLNSLILCKEIY